MIDYASEHPLEHGLSRSEALIAHGKRIKGAAVEWNLLTQEEKNGFTAGGSESTDSTAIEKPKRPKCVLRKTFDHAIMAFQKQVLVETCGYCALVLTCVWFPSARNLKTAAYK